MRHHFQSQPDLQVTPIEKIRLPLKSRDELPPILAGLIRFPELFAGAGSAPLKAPRPRR